MLASLPDKNNPQNGPSRMDTDQLFSWASRISDGGVGLGNGLANLAGVLVRHLCTDTLYTFSACLPHSAYHGHKGPLSWQEHSQYVHTS